MKKLIILLAAVWVFQLTVIVPDMIAAPGSDPLQLQTAKLESWDVETIWPEVQAALAKQPQDADLLVMEGTYTLEHRELAKHYLHSTAADAADTAVKAGAHRLALTHFSQRYLTMDKHLRDAGQIFANVIVLNDLDQIEIPRRR